MTRRRQFECIDCRIDTDVIDEYYMLKDAVWSRACPDDDGKGMLCVACCERRLGRLLSFGDFINAPINTGWPQSPLLEHRYNRYRRRGAPHHREAKPRQSSRSPLTCHHHPTQFGELT
jgi:hypothetical protein